MGRLTVLLSSPICSAPALCTLHAAGTLPHRLPLWWRTPLITLRLGYTRSARHASRTTRRTAHDAHRRVLHHALRCTAHHAPRTTLRHAPRTTRHTALRSNRVA